MTPYTRALSLSAALLLGALSACGPGAGGSAPKQAPDFSLKTLEGKDFTLASTRGDVVLLDFWATWCGPCEDSIPVFERVHKKYEGKGLQVLGVNVDGGPEDVPAFVKKFKMQYPILMDNDYAVMRAYKVRGIPNLFLLDKKGAIRKHWIGVDDDLEAVLEKEIGELLKEG